jgi:hypothetical protein
VRVQTVVYLGFEFLAVFFVGLLNVVVVSLQLVQLVGHLFYLEIQFRLTAFTVVF